MLDREASQIKLIVQSSQWEVLTRFAENLISKIAQEPCATDTEWDTIRKTITREGKISGIRELFKELILTTIEDDDTTTSQ